MKKIIIGIITFTLIIGATIYIAYISKDNKITESNGEVVITTKEEIMEPVIETTTKEVESTTKTTESRKTDKTTITKKTVTTTKKKENVVNTTKQPVKTEEVKTTTTVTTTKQPTTTEKKKDTPWEKLGMTEYQYYNEPMYKYEKVDFSVDKYGSESAARKACVEYGNNYEPYLNGEVAYHCTIVTSASGRYLGEWFHTEKTYE